MVRKERLELSHLSVLEPKSSASTSSATFAQTLRARIGHFSEVASETRFRRSCNQTTGLHKLGKSGVDEGDRTLDRRSHNPELYQLSYVHHNIFS